MKIIRRKPRPAPVFTGYTHGDGTRREDAPKDWPFGVKLLHAKPKVVKRKES